MLDTGSLVLIVGFGLKTGLASARFVRKRGARIRLVDQKPLVELKPALEALGEEAEVIAGEMPLRALDDVSLILLSPGVPRRTPLIQEAIRRGLPVIGDIELASRYARSRIAALTGTDGKTTTTAMLGSILGDSGTLAGNIGIPVLSVLDDLPPEKTLVLELSSFMLESIDRFKPRIAAILNFGEDHLDRYRGLEDYLEAKLRIFKNLDQESLAVWPSDTAWSSEFAKAIPSGVRSIRFALNDPTAELHLGEDEAGTEAIILKGRPLLAVADLLVRGRHNLANALAAAAIASGLGLKSERIKAGLLSFKGLRHRFEVVGEFSGVRFINDSKATTISAVSRAIEAAQAGACLLLGGRDKGLDFSPLKDRLSEKNLRVFPFGEAREKIIAQLSLPEPGYPELKEATTQAWLVAREEKSEVILSPGCTSYDEFENFEVRGDAFRALAKTLAEGRGDG